MQNKIRDKQKASECLDQLKKLKTSQDALFNAYKKEKANQPFMQQLKLHKNYTKLRDLADRKADKLVEKYKHILNKHKKIRTKDYLKYGDGLLDKKYLDDFFN